MSVVKKLIEVVSLQIDQPENTVFHPGDTVSGILTVASLSDAEQQVCELSIRMLGRAQLQWNAGGVLDNDHGAHETYFNYVHFLHRQDGTKMIVPAGASMEFPFHVTFPDQKLPCSFQSSQGVLKYSIRGVLIPEPSPGQTKEDVEASFVDKDLTFFADYDVSTCPGANNPIRIKWSNQGCTCNPFLCCKATNTFKFSVHSVKSGYINGEKIEFSVHFHNQSKTQTPDMIINFIQKTTYVAEDKSQKTYPGRLISQWKAPLVAPGKSLKEKGHFIVPEDGLPTRLGGSTIIHYEYFMEVKLDLNDSNLVAISSPILVGSTDSKSAINTNKP